ncbi:MAG: class I SAM-dependent methyltransferase [Chloroflexi bacterium]|nr:class I SAM-dependent methyltransferase [Chloroflexota bacterium]
MPRRATRVDDFPNREVLDDIAIGMERAAALKAAVELEIFTRIAEGRRTLAALARSGGLDERDTRLLLNALCFSGLLIKRQNEYHLAPTAEAFLVKGKATYQGETLLGDWAWDARGDLARTVRTGKPLLANPFSDALEPIRAGRAAAYLADWQTQLALANEFWSKIDLARKNARVLAVGSESGFLPFALAKPAAGIRVTLVERPMVITYARQLADAMAVAAQVTFLPSSKLDLDDVGDAYDLILFENVNQFLSTEQNVGLFRKAYEALTPDGRFALRAPLAEDDPRGTEVSLRGLGLMLYSADGDAYAYSEYRGMLEAAGMNEVALLKDDWGLVTARRAVLPAIKKEKAKS